MAIQSLRTAPLSVSKPRFGPSPGDLKTAAELKGAILQTVARIRLGRPLSAEACPSNDKGQWTAPNGHRLIPVTLSEPPPDSRDAMSVLGLVDPKTNQFYLRNIDGRGRNGVYSSHGPLSLPPGTQFKDKTFSASDIKALTRAANGLTIPNRAIILGAMGSYEFHKVLKWNAQAPATSEVVKKVFLKKDDQYSYTGLVLKSDLNRVVIMRTGDVSGKASYSQTIDVTRLPK